MENRALFLDRDGVINKDYGYVHTKETFCFTDEIFSFSRKAIEKGYSLFVVTNQSGIGRGLYSESEFLELTDWMLSVFASNNIQIKKVYFCPYHATEGLGKYKFDSFDRKPKPGMLLRAALEYNLDLSMSVLIGDQDTDMLAGAAAGVGKLIKLTSGANARVSSKSKLDLANGYAVHNISQLNEAEIFL